jgi:hypothetical protein
MKMARCDREAEVVRAARSGEWPEEVREHTRDCAECADAALVAAFLAREDLQPGGPLPDPDRIWWKAQMQARRDAVKRATRPITFIEKGALVLGGAAALAALPWAWPALSAVPRLFSSFWTQQQAAASALAATPATFSSLFVIAAVGLLPAAVALSVLANLRVRR